MTNCPLLTKIPLIPGLKTLWCDKCPILTNREVNEVTQQASLPLIPGLQELNCSNCPLLTNLPLIVEVGLKKLNCSNCESLTHIPSIQGLLYLDCSGCNDQNIPIIGG